MAGNPHMTTIFLVALRLLKGKKPRSAANCVTTLSVTEAEPYGIGYSEECRQRISDFISLDADLSGRPF